MKYKKSEIIDHKYSTKKYELLFLISLRMKIFLVVRECEVYSKNHAAPFSKVITFHKKEPFDLEAFYSSPHELPYPDSRIGMYYCVASLLSC